jgi:hypothetical protein
MAGGNDDTWDISFEALDIAIPQPTIRVSLPTGRSRAFARARRSCGRRGMSCLEDRAFSTRDKGGSGS